MHRLVSLSSLDAKIVAMALVFDYRLVG